MVVCFVCRSNKLEKMFAEIQLLKPLHICIKCEKTVDKELEYDDKPFKLNGRKWLGGREKKGVYKKIWIQPKKKTVPKNPQQPEHEFEFKKPVFI